MENLPGKFRSNSHWITHTGENPINAVNGKKPLEVTPYDTLKFTLERNPNSAMNVGKAFWQRSLLNSASQNPQWREIVNVSECRKAFIWHTAFLKHQRLLYWEKLKGSWENIQQGKNCLERRQNLPRREVYQCNVVELFEAAQISPDIR